MKTNRNRQWLRAFALLVSITVWQPLVAHSQAVDPKTIPGLVRWIEPATSSYADGEEILQLDDQSGHPNNWMQRNNGKGPLMRRNGTNGFPDADFSNGGTLWAQNAVTTAVTAFAVVTAVDTAYNPISNGGNAMWRDYNGFGAFGLYRKDRIDYYPETMPASGLHVFAIMSGPNYYDVWVDGVKQGRRPPQFNLGLYLQILGPTLSEYIEYDNVLVDADVLRMTKSLGMKYGITLGSQNTWNQESGNGGWRWDTAPVLSPTSPWEDIATYEPTVLQLADGSFIMTYTGGWDNSAIGLATSNDGAHWTKQTDPIVGLGFGGESGSICRSALIQTNGTLYLIYSDKPGGGNLRRIESTDGGATWGHNITVLSETCLAGTPHDVYGWANSCVLIENGVWKLWSEAMLRSNLMWQTFYSESTDGVNFMATAGSGDPHPQGPLTTLQRGQGMFGGPWVLKLGSTYHLWYHASLTGYIPTDVYHALSLDGVNWTQIPNPVLYRVDDPTPGAQSGGDFYPPSSYYSQVADACVVQLQDGTSAVYFEHLKNDNASVPKLTSEIVRATFPGTLDQLGSKALTRPASPTGLRVLTP